MDYELFWKKLNENEKKQLLYYHNTRLKRVSIIKNNDLITKIASYCQVEDRDNLRLVHKTFSILITPTTFESELKKRIQRCIDFIKPLIQFNVDLVKEVAFTFAIAIVFPSGTIENKNKTSTVDFIMGIVFNPYDGFVAHVESNVDPIIVMNMTPIQRLKSIKLGLIENDKIRKMWARLNTKERIKWRQYCLNQLNQFVKVHKDLNALLRWQRTS